MASAKIDKLIKSVAGLETAIRQKEQQNDKNKKSAPDDKIKQCCAEIREILAGFDNLALAKNDKRYEGEFAKAIDVLFNLANHPEQLLRTLAEETLDSAFRAQLLCFQHARVLVRLITEVAKNGPSRSLVAAFNRLCALIQFSKANRLTSYGLHIVSALTAMLRRPEEAVQTALDKGVPLIFAVLGPRLKEQHVDKAFELYRVAAENLDLPGAKGRAAVTIIAQICEYYPSVLKKVVSRCLVNIRKADLEESKQRVIGFLNVIKVVWPMAVTLEESLPADNLQGIIVGALLCLHVDYSDVVEASLKALPEIMAHPIADMNFYPPILSNKFSSERSGPSTERSFNNGSPPAGSCSSLITSPLGSTLDLSLADPSDPLCVNFNEPLELLDHGSDGTLSDDGTEQGEIIDPLLHADLYEEQKQEEEEAKKQELLSQQSTPTRKMTEIPGRLPEGFCPSTSNCYTYSALLLGRQFLLSGIKGLKNDREIRISHKILALNCLGTIARNEPSIGRAQIQWGDGPQALSEVARFVLHDDDALCASALEFIAACEQRLLKQAEPLTEMFPYCIKRLERVFHQKRKRALLQTTLGETDLLCHYGLFPNICRVAIESISGSYGLLKATSAAWFSAIEWSKLTPELRSQWQRPCLEAFLKILFSGDAMVEKEAAEFLPRLVKNVELGAQSNAFHHALPENYIGAGFPEIPVVLGLPSTYSFCDKPVDFTYEENLELILANIFQFASEDSVQSASGLVFGLASLVEAFPPSIYRECWQSAFRTQSGIAGLLSLMVELAELNSSSPTMMVKALQVISGLFSGQMEGQLMRVVHEQMVPDRKLLPKQLDVLLTERLVLLPLRILNAYYALLTEHRSLMSQSSSGILSRPNITSMNNKNIKTASSARIADISRLLGTSIHPTKPSSFLECPSLKSMFPQIRGAFSNYLEKIGAEQDRRLTKLLTTALHCLSVLLEMVTYQAIRPQLEEILLYLKVIFEIEPAGCTRLLHQLFKLVFGKNAANINLETLHQLNLKHPLPPSDKLDMYLVRSINEFTLFAAFLNRFEFLDVYVRRHVGWLRADLLSKVHVPENSEISSSLLLFEGFINKLIALYPNFNSLPTKCAILNVMCELPRDGVQYALADPKGKLFDVVQTQIEDMFSTHTNMIQETFLYLTVLARTGYIEWNRVEDIVEQVLDRTPRQAARNALSALDVLVCENLIAQKKAGTHLWRIWLQRAAQFMEWDPEGSSVVWTIFLHGARRDEQRWKEWSIEAWSIYQEWLTASSSKLSSSTCHAQIVFLSSLASQTFSPIDSFFNLLKNCLFEKSPSHIKLSKILPLFFLMVSSMTEEQIQTRIDQLAEKPVELLVRGIFDVIWKATTEAKEHDVELEELIIFMLQSMSYCLRSEKLPKFSSCLRFHTTTEPSSVLLRLHRISPKILVHWLSFFSLTPSALPVFLEILSNPKFKGHTFNITILLLVDLIQTESLSNSHLAKLFDPAAAVNLPLLLVTIAERKMVDIFVSALNDESFELFLSTVAVGAKESLNIKAALDTIALAKKFIEHFKRKPCEEKLLEMTEKLKPYCPVLEQKLTETLGLEQPHEFDGISGFAISRNLEFLTHALKNYQNCPIDAVLKGILQVPTQELYELFEALDKSQRKHFFTVAIQAAEECAIGRAAEPEDQRKCLANAQELIDTLEDFIAQDPEIALQFYAKMQPVLLTTSLNVSDLTEGTVHDLLKWIWANMPTGPIELLGEFLAGLKFLFTTPSASEIFRQQPLAHLSMLRELLFSIVGFLDQVSYEPYHQEEVSGIDITGVSVDSDNYRYTSELFDIVQHISRLYRTQKIPSRKPGMKKLEEVVRVMFRHPLLHSMAMVPETAMKMEWRPRMEIRGENSFSIPLVNIHLLSNYDVLTDFAWRVNWLGWTTRQQFEDSWMSLFGVLSSTPTGSELTQENATQYTEQILSSAKSVEALTELLLSSLLYPEPGNSICSHFVVKHRERTETYRSKSIRQLTSIKARLLGDKDPSTVFQRNIERLIPEVGWKYGPSQLSALSLWSLTGVLNDEKTPTGQNNSPRLKASVSEYLLRMNCELDTASSVRALFDNYAHWLSRGLEYLSLPLLSATVRSMALLSDLFDDSTSYLLLYEQMRNIYNSRILQHHPDFGYVIYSILKAVTVLGVEPLESKLSELDFGKHLLGFVEMGLTSHYAVVREHTLHGVLYFLQSMAGESMRPIIQYVSTFLIDEITKQLAITDPVLINSSPSSINYSTVIWATAFRIMEEPVQGNFKQSLNQKLCEALLVANLPHWTLELITAGIETLIFHSTAFSEQFAAVARESFQDYHFHTGKFPYALRIFVDCIFREEADPSRNSAHKFQPLLQTAIGLIHRCYPADALLLAKVFPPILRRLYKDHKALEIILDMLFPDQKIHLPENAHAVFVIIFEFFESLRENQRLASCLQLSSIIVKRLSEILIVESEKTAATSILLTAAHGDSEVASRFHLLLEMYEREPMDWSFYHDWILQKTAEMLVSEGIALCVPLPEPVDLAFLASCFPCD